MAENWLGAAGRNRLWELAALNGEDGSGLTDSFFSYAFERRDQRHGQLTQFSWMVSEKVKSVVARLTEAATGSTR